MAKILTFGPQAAQQARKPAPAPLRAPLGSDVFLVPFGHPPHQGWTVFDESPSGGSAGSHGEFMDRDEAVREGRKLAEEIGGNFQEGGAACP